MNINKTRSTALISEEQSNETSKRLNDYRVYIVTWNVGTHFPDNISLRNILDLQNDVENRNVPDIYAFGLQEVNTQPQQQIYAMFKDDPWIIKAKDLLQSLSYVLVKSEQMQGIQLSIFVRRIHVPHLRDIEGVFTRTGFGGMWGNKGAVSIRFSFYGFGLTFVNSHLAAHDDCLDERIEHFQQIMKNHRYGVKNYQEIYDHDYVFWFGDLNFRLSGDDSPKELCEKLKDSEMFRNIFKRDQLAYVRETTREAFQMMHESKVNFPPTFKYKDGTSEYDLKRRPAWTDRILYAVQPSKSEPNKFLEIKQCSYTSHPTYSFSDHKPVSGLFKIQLNPLYRNAHIKFCKISVWQIGKEHTIKYTTSGNFNTGSHDWVGLYHKDYASLRDYITYEYINPVDSSGTNVDAVRHQYNEEQVSSQDTSIGLLKINFTNDIKLKSGEQYVLIYFQCTGLRGITSVVAVSNTFRAENRSSPVNYINVD